MPQPTRAVKCPDCGKAFLRYRIPFMGIRTFGVRQMTEEEYRAYAVKVHRRTAHGIGVDKVPEWVENQRMLAIPGVHKGGA